MKKLAVAVLSLFVFVACGPNTIQVHNAVVGYMNRVTEKSETFFFTTLESEDLSEIRAAYDELDTEVRHMTEYFAEQEFPENRLAYKEYFDSIYGPFIADYVDIGGKAVMALEAGEDARQLLIDFDEKNEEFVQVHGGFVDVVSQ